MDSYAGYIGGNLSHNLFIYCENNPINRIDPDGYAWYTETINTIKKTYNTIKNIFTKKKKNTKKSTNAVKTKTIVAYEPVSALYTGAIETASSTKKSEKPCTTAWVGEKDVQRGRRLTKSQAINQVRLGQSVMCDTRRDARAVANAFFQGYLDPPHEGDKNSKYYPHYHPWGNSHIHIWYYPY